MFWYAVKNHNELKWWWIVTRAKRSCFSIQWIHCDFTLSIQTCSEDFDFVYVLWVMYLPSKHSFSVIKKNWWQCTKIHIYKIWLVYNVKEKKFTRECM